MDREVPLKIGLSARLMHAPPPELGFRDKVLQYLTKETGGLTYFPFRAQDLEQDFENIANELRHQYNIFYRPEPLKADGLYHTVDLKVKGRKDLVVRARKGYYAPKM